MKRRISFLSIVAFSICANANSLSEKEEALNKINTLNNKVIELKIIKEIEELKLKIRETQLKSEEINNSAEEKNIPKFVEQPLKIEIQKDEFHPNSVELKYIISKGKNTHAVLNYKGDNTVVFNNDTYHGWVVSVTKTVVSLSKHGEKVNL